MKKIFTILTILAAGFQASAQCTDLFFSEYIEGSSNNKALEIYNPTGAAIDLSDYIVKRSNNGSGTVSGSVVMAGMLQPADVYVLANPSAAPDILAVSDSASTITFYNGDDAIWLEKISTGDTLDIIGVLGVDPGSFWPVDTGSTKEYTLVRKIGIQNGETDWAIGATEWDVYAQNMTDSLGMHTMTPCAVGPCTPTSSSIMETACDTYTSPSGMVYTASAMFNDTINNVSGCDSVISIDLTINNSTSFTIFVTNCGPYNDMNGNTYPADTLITETFVAANGCDSIQIIDLTIAEIYSLTDVISSCGDSYTWIDGNTYTANNNTATSSFLSTDGCDSIITLDLTLTSVDTSVTVSGGGAVIANQSGAAYQWIDCDNGNAPIAGETSQTYNYTLIQGNVAVTITYMGCTETSNCHFVSALSLNESNPFENINIFPNPSHGPITVQLNGLNNVDLDLINIAGKKIVSLKNISDSKYVLDGTLPAGVYFLTLQAEGESQTYKLVIK